MAFALNSTFVDGEVTAITREQGLMDGGGDPVGTENANFYVGLPTELPVPCFVAGTRIETDRGAIVVEDLRVGDLVVTLDNGLQPVRWTGSRSVPVTGSFTPILIKAGALENTRNLRISTQHRLLMRGWHAELLFGCNEVLVAAKHLCNDSTIRRDRTAAKVTYHHILLDKHEVIVANGAASESLDPACLVKEPCELPAGPEVAALLPELLVRRSARNTARRTLKSHEGRLLRHS